MNLEALAMVTGFGAFAAVVAANVIDIVRLVFALRNGKINKNHNVLEVKIDNQTFSIDLNQIDTPAARQKIEQATTAVKNVGFCDA